MTLFPGIPTVANGRALTALQADTSGTRTFPSLSSLTKNAGDLLIAICACYQSDTSPYFGSWGASFTEFLDAGTAASMCIGAAYKWSTGSETGTFTVTQSATITGHAALLLLSIPGADLLTPPEHGVRTNNTTAAATPSLVTPSWGAEDTMWIGVCGSGETSLTGTYDDISAAPTNYSGLITTGMSADAIGAVAAAVAFRLLNAGSETPGAFTMDLSNARNTAVGLCVRPRQFEGWGVPI